MTWNTDIAALVEQGKAAVPDDALLSLEDGTVTTGYVVTRNGESYAVLAEERTLDLSEIKAWMPYPEPYSPKEDTNG